MGHKVQTFAGIITNPMNTHKFRVVIPGVDENLTAIVESTEFPTQGAFGQVQLWYQGFQILYPTLPATAGQWQFTIPESDDGKIAAAFDKLMSSMYEQKSGIFVPTLWKDISIFANDITGENIVFHSVLHGAWLSRHQPVGLSAANPGNAWKNTYIFVYQFIEDKLVGNSSPSQNPFGS